MKYRIIISIIVLITFLCCVICGGCVATRQTAIKISAENIENTNTLRIIANDCISIWPMYSGVIKGLFGDTLSAETIAAIKELDRLAEQTEHTDYELGYFMGIKAHITQAIIEKIIPDLLKSIPIIF